MKTLTVDRPFYRKTLFAGLIILCLLAFTPHAAQAQETGNFCVWDYKSDANCTAQDVRIKEMRLVSVAKPCYAAPNIGYMDVVFELLVSAEKSTNRYDIGLFMALDGGSALEGNNCFHDYLQPPLTDTPVYSDKNLDGFPDIDNGPWWNAWPGGTNTCGDMESGTQVFKQIEQVTVKCSDFDNNGLADIHVCTSWDIDSSATCTGIKQAFPGTKSKCGCTTVNFNFTPNAIGLATFSARNEAPPAKLVLGVLGLLAGGGLMAGVVVKKRRS